MCFGYLFILLTFTNMEELDYKIGDIVTSDNGAKPKGICTGFKWGCVLVNGRNMGGARYHYKYKGEVSSEDMEMFAEEAKESERYNEWNKTHDLHGDKVEISIIALIEIERAFSYLKKNKDSYLHKVFSDDYLFYALDELKKTYNEYFEKDEFLKY